MKAHWSLEMLPEEAFKKEGGSLKLYKKGGGGSSAPAPTNTSVTQTNLPEYARPYFENLLNRTQAQSYQGYTPYGGPRIAGFTPEQQGIQQDFANLQTPGQFGQATSGMQATGGLGMGAAATGLGQALAYNPFTAQSFGSPQAAAYMNPYQQNVTDTALREATQKGAIDKSAGAMGAIGRGTFGGARQALIQAEQGRGLNQQLSDIQYQGSQQGYQNAQQQFNADQARQQQAQQYAAGLGQQLFGAGLSGAQQAATGLGALGAQQQTSELARLNAQQASAATQQQQTQNQYDTAYQDFLRQRDYPQEQLGFYSNILRGLPTQLASTTQTYSAPPSVAGQLMGLGSLGLAANKAFG
jgi:hypothetical protein